MPKNQADLTRNARERGMRPEALCVTTTNTTVLLTSWPWWDEGDVAKVMARTVPEDPMTNAIMDYSALDRKVGEMDL